MVAGEFLSAEEVGEEGGEGDVGVGAVEGGEGRVEEEPQLGGEEELDVVGPAETAFVCIDCTGQLLHVCCPLLPARSAEPKGKQGHQFDLASHVVETMTLPAHYGLEDGVDGGGGEVGAVAMDERVQQQGSVEGELSVREVAACPVGDFLIDLALQQLAETSKSLQLLQIEVQTHQQLLGSSVQTQPDVHCLRKHFQHLLSMFQSNVCLPAAHLHDLFPDQPHLTPALLQSHHQSHHFQQLPHSARLPLPHLRPLPHTPHCRLHRVDGQLPIAPRSEVEQQQSKQRQQHWVVDSCDGEDGLDLDLNELDRGTLGEALGEKGEGGGGEEGLGGTREGEGEVEESPAERQRGVGGEEVVHVVAVEDEGVEGETWLSQQVVVVEGQEGLQAFEEFPICLEHSHLQPNNHNGALHSVPFLLQQIPNGS